MGKLLKRLAGKPSATGMVIESGPTVVILPLMTMVFTWRAFQMMSRPKPKALALLPMPLATAALNFPASVTLSTPVKSV